MENWEGDTEWLLKLKLWSLSFCCCIYVPLTLPLSWLCHFSRFHTLSFGQFLFEFWNAKQWKRSILMDRDGKCSINIWLKRNFNYNSSNAEQKQINKQTAFQIIILHFQWIVNTIKRASLFSYNYLSICL